ncbi:hypothetical protein KUCAC02_031287, partial [Chaenocephalus aceratus]
NIQPNPIIAVFGVAPEGVSLSNCQSHSLAFATLLARRLILLKWKDRTPPSHAHWVRDVMAHLQLEELRYCSQGCVNKYYKLWQPFLDHFNKLPCANLTA